jgi:hypothetical protein
MTTGRATMLDQAFNPPAPHGDGGELRKENYKRISGQWPVVSGQNKFPVRRSQFDNLQTS